MNKLTPFIDFNTSDCNKPHYLKPETKGQGIVPGRTSKVELRRVPSNWTHPKDEKGNYIPLFDGLLVERHNYKIMLYKSRAREGFATIDDMLYWMGSPFTPCEDGLIDPKTATQGYTAFEATSYCLYETVTEGTPKSPVFDTLKDMAVWIKQANDGRTLNHILANLISLLQ